MSKIQVTLFLPSVEQGSAFRLVEPDSRGVQVVQPIREEAHMKLGKLVDRAKSEIEKRGGTEALRKDADEVRNIAKGPGSFSEKAKKAAEAVKDPGAKGQDGTPKPQRQARSTGAK
jgi:hypothetical protein